MFNFDQLMLTLIFGIWASESPPTPGPGERLKRPGLIGLNDVIEKKLSVTNGDNIVAGWYKCQTGETKSAFRSTRASWQAMLVQMLWGF